MSSHVEHPRADDQADSDFIAPSTQMTVGIREVKEKRNVGAARNRRAGGVTWKHMFRSFTADQRYYVVITTIWRVRFTMRV